MPAIFLELYTARPACRALPTNMQTTFIEAVIEALSSGQAAGLEIIAFGRNEIETPQRAPYDFFCVYRLDSTTSATNFESQIAQSGWYDYFSQINVIGEETDVALHMRSHITS